MDINKWITDRKYVNTAKIGKARTILQELDPYTKSRTLDGALITKWNGDFINKVNTYFLSNTAGSMGPKELAVFSKYTDPLVSTGDDLYDQATKNLDAYLSTITEDDTLTTLLVAK